MRGWRLSSRPRLLYLCPTGSFRARCSVP